MVHSFSVNIRISQPSKVMFTWASPRWTSLFSGWQILMFTSKECINCIMLRHFVEKKDLRIVDVTSHLCYFFLYFFLFLTFFLQYCKFGNFREHFILANSVKRHILREKSVAIYFGHSQFRRNRTFNFIV